jgi:CheY-like chemotaxis protein
MPSLEVSLATPLKERKTPSPYVPSILIVDDDEETRRNFRQALEILGYYVAEAINGRHALNVIADRFFDLAIVDLSMPDKDGIEVIQAIKAELRQIKVLAVSGYLQGSFLHMAKKLGATSTLQKPVSDNALIAAVCELISVGTQDLIFP